jgi:hypothetical protein
LDATSASFLNEEFDAEADSNQKRPNKTVEVTAANARFGD